MKSIVLVCGHGPGISDSVARTFGRAGHSVAIVARNAKRVADDAAALVSAGIDAKGFVCDLSDPEAVRKLVAEVQTHGPIAVVHYNAYTGGGVDLLTATTEQLRNVYDLFVVGLVTIVQAARADLEATKGAVLVTGGGFCYFEPKIDAMATQYGAAGVALGKAAQHKTVGLLAAKLKPLNIYVGEVVVTGVVKGTAFDTQGNGTIDPDAVAARFYELAKQRTELTVTFA